VSVSYVMSSAVIGLAIASVSQAAVATGADRMVNQARSTAGHQEAAEIARRFVAFVQVSRRYQDLSPEKVERALGVHLHQNEDNLGYGIVDIGEGWSFAISLSFPDRERRALHVFIQNDSNTASAVSACLLPLEQTRTAWREVGYYEWTERGEIGQLIGLDGSRDEITVHVDSRRVIVDGGRQCIANVVVTADK